MIMDNIAEGDAGWIAVAGAYVLPGTDAGATTDFIVSLAYGLPRNPEAVLALETDAHVSLLAVCSLPFIEAEESFIQAYGAKTLQALAAVDRPYLAAARDACIRRLQDNLSR